MSQITGNDVFCYQAFKLQFYFLANKIKKQCDGLKKNQGQESTATAET